MIATVGSPGKRRCSGARAGRNFLALCGRHGRLYTALSFAGSQTEFGSQNFKGSIRSQAVSLRRPISKLTNDRGQVIVNPSKNARPARTRGIPGKLS